MIVTHLTQQLSQRCFYKLLNTRHIIHLEDIQSVYLQTNQ